MYLSDNINLGAGYTNVSTLIDSRDKPVFATDFNRDVYCLFGLAIDAISIADTANKLKQACNSAQQVFFSTPNLNFLVKSFHNPEFRNSVLISDLTVPDGMPLVWIAKFLGLPIRERVAGSSVFELMQGELTTPTSVYFFGGPQGAAQRAATAITKRNTAMSCAGFMSPGYADVSELSATTIIDRINACQPKFLVVALGAEKGQAWIVSNRHRLQARVISYLGAVVNMVAGEVKRAPRILQRLGLEWLWRIKEEPSLWRRYWNDGLFFLRIILCRLLPAKWLLFQQTLFLNKSNSEIFEVRADTYKSGDTTLSLSGHCFAKNIDKFRHQLTSLTSINSNITLDLTEVVSMDCSFIGILILLYGHQLKNNLSFTVVGTSNKLSKLFYCLNTNFVLQGFKAV